MSHTVSAPRGVVFRPDLFVIIALAAGLGFTLGQSWPSATTPEITIPGEDWHGNVRASNWR